MPWSMTLIHFRNKVHFLGGPAPYQKVFPLRLPVNIIEMSTTKMSNLDARARAFSVNRLIGLMSRSSTDITWSLVRAVHTTVCHEQVWCRGQCCLSPPPPPSPPRTLSFHTCPLVEPLFCFPTLTAFRFSHLLAHLFLASLLSSLLAIAAVASWQYLVCLYCDACR